MIDATSTLCAPPAPIISTPSVSNWMLCDDKALVDAAKLGDRRAFEAIIHRYGRELLRYSNNLLGDFGAAEDAVQEAFVSAWTGLENFRGDSALKTWLYSVVTKKTIDHRRKRIGIPRDAGQFEHTVTDYRLDPDTQANNSAFRSNLEAALADLPHRQRECWLMREVEEMKHLDIGTVMTMSPDAVRGQVSRARVTLHDRLHPWR